MSKHKTLFEKFKAIQKVGIEVDIPWEVAHVLAGEIKTITALGDQVCIGDDYVSLENARKAVTWYATQLGGTIEWKS